LKEVVWIGYGLEIVILIIKNYNIEYLNSVSFPLNVLFLGYNLTLIIHSLFLDTY